MAASIRINSSHGATDDASTTDTAGTTIFFKNTGDTDTNTSGVVKPGGSPNFSIIKSHRIYVQSGPIHLVNNLKFYWTGTALTGVDVGGKISATYVDHTTSPGNGAAVVPGLTSMYTYTSIAPLSQDGSFVTGTDTAPKFIGNFLILQLSVASTATVANAVTLGSLVARYDES